MTCENAEMLRIIRERLRQKYRTMRYPAAEPPPMPDRFRGVPVLPDQPCPGGCRECIDSCPTDALSLASETGRLQIDLGRCIFCGDCAAANPRSTVAACPKDVLSFSRDYRMAARKREHLVIGPEKLPVAEALGTELRRLLGRALRLRQVSAGGCNACEADANVLTTVGWDIGRFGIQFVASPRHADGLLVTGPVTTNMQSALLKTYDAVPDPKIVIASGACAISGGIYRGSAVVCDGVTGILPVDLFVPGCPPHPLTLLDGLLRLIGRTGRAF
jgi:Ni,Fe-hydrogenase III small subunit/formate hydrogenlyase subunit 6/NADH:ubiquinone oxidoreductase subunit I